MTSHSFHSDDFVLNTNRSRDTKHRCIGFYVWDNIWNQCPWAVRTFVFCFASVLGPDIFLWLIGIIRLMRLKFVIEGFQPQMSTVAYHCQHHYFRFKTVSKTFRNMEITIYSLNKFSNAFTLNRNYSQFFLDHLPCSHFFWLPFGMLVETDQQGSDFLRSKEMN